MADAENPYAGQGPVLLDIGGDVGALIVRMPASAEGLEVEIRPAGATAGGVGPAHEHTHAHPHVHDHDHVHPHDSVATSPYPHVGVVARPSAGGTVYSLVYPSVVEGDYELYPLPDGPVGMTATVGGGSVTEVDWPG
jgi:hypothetical protein